jgi:hypothetical protein
MTSPIRQAEADVKYVSRSETIYLHCCPVDGGYDFSIALQDKGF